MKRRRVFARKSIRRLRLLLLFLCALVLVFVVLFSFRPVLTAFAENRAVWTATEIANETIAVVLEEYEPVCNDIIRVNYTGNQQLSSVMPNTASINTIRTAIVERTMEKINQVTTLSIAIPMGTLLGPDWLSGWGPLLTFPLSYTATVLSDVSSSFEAVGINQSNYRILIHLDIHLCVITPGGRSTVTTQICYPMAEAVLLGEVPDNLTEVYGDDQSVLGKIFDYGTAE